MPILPFKVVACPLCRPDGVENGRRQTCTFCAGIGEVNMTLMEPGQGKLRRRCRA